MRYLITGGYGALGYYLARKLRELEHDVAILDKHEDWYFDEEFEDVEIQECFDAGSIQRAFINFKPDVVFHCAEETIPDPALVEHMTHSLTFTTTVLRICSANAIRCVVPSWNETKVASLHDKEHTIWSKTVLWRAELVKFFRLGNSINNVVYMPRLIGEHFNINTFGNLVKRVYNAANTGGIAKVWENEVPLFGKDVYCCDVINAVDELIEIADRRSRAEAYIMKSGVAPANYIAGHTLFLAKGHEEVELMTERQEPVYVSAKDYSEAVEVYPTILNAIERSVDVWQRQP